MHNSLTAGSLRGPGKLAIPPIVFAKEDESEAIGELFLHIHHSRRDDVAVRRKGMCRCGYAVLTLQL